MAVAVAAVVWLVARQLAEAAKEHPRFRIDPHLLAAEAVPRWMPPEVADRLRAEFAKLPSLSIFDPSLEQRVANAFRPSASGPGAAWVASVGKIERIFPNRVRVDLALRRPVAFVDRDGRRTLLDGDGVALHSEPIESVPPVGTVLFPLLGVDPGVDPKVGEHCADDGIRSGVLAAAELLLHLDRWSREVPSVRIAGIEVGRRGDTAGAPKGEVFLVTPHGVRIRWGRPARSDHFGLLELPVPRKIANLAAIAELFPSLVGLEEVWVSFDQPSYRPLDGPVMLVLNQDALASQP